MSMEVERSNSFASKGVGAAGLTLGTIGTALGALNGGLGNILGGWGNNCGNGWGGCYNGYGYGAPVIVSEGDRGVNRYEAEQSARIAQLETEVKLRDANTFTMNEMGKLRDYMERKFDHVEHELCDQRAFNAGIMGKVGCIGDQVAELMGLTKRVVPNGSICPGWGDVTVSITPATDSTTTG